MTETRNDNTLAIILTVGLHVGLVALLLLSTLVSCQRTEISAAGEPIQATLAFSKADLRAAQQAIKASPPPAKPDVVEQAPVPQPVPVPSPQDSDIPIQNKPQQPQDQPDTVDQDEINRNALLKAETERKEQEERTRQAQVDLTEDIERQQEAERKQRLREQYEAIKKERADAERRTLMEEQRLQQLADAKPTPSAASPSPPSPQAGNRGRDEGLKARYIAALYATTRANWNSSLAAENTRCDVSFTQIPGGEVINVEFRQCAYDAQGRESVERALRKTPMPYSGFEPVFARNVTLTLCHPEEACLR